MDGISQLRVHPQRFSILASGQQHLVLYGCFCPRHHAAVAHPGCVVERQKPEVCNRLARDVLHTRRRFHRSDIADFPDLLNENSGLLNVPLIALGLEPIDWLGDRAFVKIALIIVIGWRSFGLLTIYFLAGLQSIPAELYEAAEIDGASTIQRFFFVTIPLLKPIILFVSIIVMLGSIQVFDEPRILTGGGPANASITVVQYLYQRGFERLRFGFASSVGTILFLVVFVVSFIQLRFFGTFRADGDN